MNEQLIEKLKNAKLLKRTNNENDYLLKLIGSEITTIINAITTLENPMLNVDELWDKNSFFLSTGSDVKMMNKEQFIQAMHDFANNSEQNKIKKNIIDRIEILKSGIDSLQTRRKIQSNGSIISDIDDSINQLNQSITMLEQILAI